MNWDHLKVFLAVARHGTALAAAREMGVNHSTVIRRIDQLEEDLSLKLFTRLQSGYQLNAEGRRVMAAAEQMEEGALLLSRQLRGIEAVEAGSLKLSLPEQCLFDVSPLLHAFMSAYPQIELNILSTVEASDLSRMEADIAVRLTDRPPQSMIGRQLGRVEFAVYGHKDYLQRFSATPKPTECDWLLWQGRASSDIETVRHPDVLLEQALPGARIALRCNSVQSILSAMQQGLGVGLLAKPMAERCPDLVALPYQKLLEQVAVASVGLWLLVHPDMRQSLRVKALQEFAQRHLNAELNFESIGEAGSRF